MRRLVYLALALVALVAITSAPACGTQRTASPVGGYRVYTEPDDGFAWLYRYLASPKATLDLSMYELEDTRAESILAADATRHVEVRVVLDHNREAAANQTAFLFLASHGVQVRWAPPGFAADHEKAIVVDRESAAIMTLNLTSRYYPNTRDFAVIDTNRSDVSATDQVFSADFGGGPSGAPGRLVWSPGSEQLFLDFIRQASKSVALESEEMSDPAVISSLEAVARRGVTVTITMTRSSDWTRAFEELTTAGVRVHVDTGETPIYIHAKVIVDDDASVLVGSQNITRTSLDDNRELGIVLTDPSLARSFGTTLGRDFATAQSWRA